MYLTFKNNRLWTTYTIDSRFRDQIGSFANLSTPTNLSPANLSTPTNLSPDQIHLPNLPLILTHNSTQNSNTLPINPHCRTEAATNPKLRQGRFEVAESEEQTTNKSQRNHPIATITKTKYICRIFLLSSRLPSSTTNSPTHILPNCNTHVVGRR